MEADVEVSIDQLIEALTTMKPINTDIPTCWYAGEYGSLVYFLACRNYVKVGHSINAAVRAAEIQRMVPYQLSVIGVLPGGQEEEARVHKALARRRHHNEWFHMNDDLERVIAMETASFKFRSGSKLDQPTRSRRNRGDFLARMHPEYAGSK